MPYSKEERKIKNKEYYLKNKKKLALQNKKYYQANKEYIKEKSIINYADRYDTDAEKKRLAIKRWKGFGMICEDFDSLYCHYLNATECENCGVEFGEHGSIGGTWKTCDHNHETGQFRNFLCHRCNILRGK